MNGGWKGGGGYDCIKKIWDCSNDANDKISVADQDPPESEAFSTHESVIKKIRFFQNTGSQIPKNHIFKKLYLV
jgi:hypothetical protein